MLTYLIFQSYYRQFKDNKYDILDHNFRQIQIQRQRQIENYKDIWPNTKRNIIHVFYNDRIQIKILYGLGNLAKYEYEYYSDCHFCPNTNTNNTEYEYDHTEYE